jgi:hypothetical protein
MYIKSRMGWGSHVTHKGEERKVYKVLVGKSRWEDGIRMYLRETGLGVWSGFSWFKIGTSGTLL